MKKIQIFVLIGLILMFGLLLETSAQTPKPSRELRIALETLYDETLHPLWGTMYRKTYFEPLYDFLVGIDEKGDFDPKQSIAYKWSEAPNRLSWTFWIRDGVKFHNGDPLTLEDVAYSIEECKSKKNIAGKRSDYEEFLDKVEIVPPDKVVVHLKKPWFMMLYFLSDRGGSEGCILPKKYIKEKGEKFFLDKPIGTGPYKVISRKEGDHIKFEAIDSHWRVGVPKYKYLTFRLIPEEGTRDAALRAGEVDIIITGIERTKKLKDSGFIIHPKRDSQEGTVRWLWNFKPEFPTNKKKVRQALIYAINKQEIVDYILMGQGEVIGHAQNMFRWSIEYKPYPLTPYDPKTAKKLLAEAGYPNGFTMYFYSFVTALPEEKRINETIASYWGEIGVNTKVLEMDYSAFKPVWTKEKEPPGPAAFLGVFASRPVYSWRAAWHSSGLYNHTKDPKLDSLVDKYESQTNLDEYIKAGQAVMDYTLEDFQVTGLFSTHTLFASNKDVPIWNMGKGTASYRFVYIGK